MELVQVVLLHVHGNVATTHGTSVGGNRNTYSIGFAKITDSRNEVRSQIFERKQGKSSEIDTYMSYDSCHIYNL